MVPTKRDDAGRGDVRRRLGVFQAEAVGEPAAPEGGPGPDTEW